MLKVPVLVFDMYKMSIIRLDTTGRNNDVKINEIKVFTCTGKQFPAGKFSKLLNL